MPDSALLMSPLFHMVLVGLAGIVIWHLIPEKRANVRLVAQIICFGILSSMLIGSSVVPYEYDADSANKGGKVIVALVKVLWWIHLAWAVIGFVRIYLVFERRPKEARLLQDLVVAAVYLGMLLSVLAFVFGVPVGTLIATSGVVAIILGLALQNTLSDLFSGIALTLGRPYVLGDWIMLADGTEGRVVHSNWRSTHLLTLANNVVILPNSYLAKLGLTNICNPDETHGIALTVRVAPTRMPAIIIDVMRSVLMSCNTIVKDPPPAVAIKGLDATAIEIELQFRITSPSQRTAARNEIFDRVYRHSKAAGLLLAMPSTASVAMMELPTEETAMPPRVSPIKLIQAIPIFSALTDKEKQVLADGAVTRSYRKGDVIARQAQSLSSLMIVRAGVISMQHSHGESSETETGRLAPGDFFGEAGLLAGMGEVCSYHAMTNVVVYEIDQQAFAPLLSDRPDMAEDLALILSRQTDKGADEASSGQQQERSVKSLLRAIQKIFRN